MIIRNFQSLSTNSAKKDALDIMKMGLMAADPGLYLKKIIKNKYLVLPHEKINLRKYEKILVVSVGKASYLMARAVDSFVCVDSGIIISPTKINVREKKFRVITAGHPFPNKNSIVAAKSIVKYLGTATNNDLVLFLISGGSSSLVSMPDGITLGEKQKTTKLLLQSGASIQEINCVRKHLSKVKGGKLLESLESNAVSLVMSDVVGDDLSSIASGMTYCDFTSFSDAKNILIKYHLDRLVPKNVLHHIDLGIKGKIAETPKMVKIPNVVITSNTDCLVAMKSRAQKLGYTVKVVKNISSNVVDLSMRMSKMTLRKKYCIIFGGESTVVVKGKGKGGRNQELVLRISHNLSKQSKNSVVASLGTDGIDGNTSYAGAIWQSDQSMNNVSKYLDDNNSHDFFKKYGGLIFTGYTGTNLLDIGVVLTK
ncbi:MAG: DUF4147 domain-containing protein [Thaumarchaeota archaeon]|nr:DUF4147 domain-containing protein [Nitrososphaerota archaeon]